MGEVFLGVSVIVIPFWIVNFFISKKLQNQKKVFLNNFIIQVVYSVFFIYKLIYDSSGGMSLVWMVYFWIALIFHHVVLLIYLIVKSRQKR